VSAMMYKLRVSRGWGTRAEPGQPPPQTHLMRVWRLVYDRYGPIGGDDWFRCVLDKPRSFTAWHAEHVARSGHPAEREILNSGMRCVRRRWEAK